jgi:LysM repeat protein
VSAAYLQSAYPLGNLAVAEGTQSPTPRTHVVRRGDNLFRLAQRYATTVEALAAANRLGHPWTIYVGQTLVIP